MPLSCIVFDCDGVILESVNVKTEAFARVAEPFGTDARDRLVAYHMEHGGVSRYKKFEWLFSEVLGREITPDEMDDLGRKYADYAFEGVLNAPMVPGAHDVITAWHGRVPLYVCSGAPHEELVHILSAGWPNTSRPSTAPRPARPTCCAAPWKRPPCPRWKW